MDPAGNRTRVTWPDAAWVQYDYNPLYAVTAIRESGATSGAGVLATFDYYDLGQRKTLTRGNGTVTDYGYDRVSRLDTLVQNLTGSAADYSSALAYQPASQMRARTQANDATYAWKGGASQAVVYGVNGLNQPTSVNGIGLTFDANGNLTRGAGTYAYDVENKLRSASAPTAVTLDYDPLGRLKQTASSTATTQFLYDGDDLVAEYDASGTLTKRHVHGPGVDEPLVTYTGPATGSSAARAWLHADERGSIVAVSDASGDATTINAYSPDGQPDSWTASRFGYTGQIALPEAMLWHYKARAYAPRLARFLQPDPIGTEGGINLYAYVTGDPVNLVDPSGLVKVIRCYTSKEGRDITLVCRIEEDEDDEEIVVNGGVCGRLCQQAKEFDNQLRITDTLNRLDRAFQLTTDAIQYSLSIVPATLDYTFKKATGQCCFVAGTLVDTEAGLRPIESVKVGEHVWSRNEATGETALKPVTALIPRHDREIVELTVETATPGQPPRRETFKTTADHPWRTVEGRWIETAQLNPGALLLRDTGAAKVVEVRSTGQTQPTYNLEVADYHTYFVGEQRLWVHNTCFPKDAKELAKYLKISTRDIHQRKNDILKVTIKDRINMKGIKNPDIGYNALGNIVLRDPANHAKLITTRIPISDFVGE